MCRNIRPLFNYAPAASPEEVRAASLQFVRKVSGSTHPSRANQDAFERAVDEISAAVATLLASLTTTAPPRSREADAERARARNAQRFGTAGS